MAVAAEENESRPRTGRYSWFIVSFSIIYEPGTASFFHRSTNQTLMAKCFVFLKYVQTFILKKFDENTIKIWVVSGYCRDLGG
jgi:hypothetical protein